MEINHNTVRKILDVEAEDSGTSKIPRYSIVVKIRQDIIVVVTLLPLNGMLLHCMSNFISGATLENIERELRIMDLESYLPQPVKSELEQSRIITREMVQCIQRGEEYEPINQENYQEKKATN